MKNSKGYDTTKFVKMDPKPCCVEWQRLKRGIEDVEILLQEADRYLVNAINLAGVANAIEVLYRAKQAVTAAKEEGPWRK